MFRSQALPLDGQRLPLGILSLGKASLPLINRSQRAERGGKLRMLGPEEPPAHFQGLLAQNLRLSELPLGLEDAREVVEGSGDVRMFVSHSPRCIANVSR